MRLVKTIGFSVCYLILSVGLAVGEPIKVGALLCLSGSCAADGQGSLNGMNLALKELPQVLGGLELKIVAQDTNEATSGTAAVTSYRSLYNSGVRFFVGPTWSSAAQALSPILAKAHDVIALTPSAGTPVFHLAGDNIFNLRGTDEQAIRKTAQIARALGVKRIAIFGSQQNWSVEQSNTFENEFVSMGGEVVAKVEPLPGETDLKSFALKLLAAKPEGIFISVFAESPIVVKELAAKQYLGKKFAAAVLPYMLEQAKVEFEGIIFNTFAPPTGIFAERYKKEFGTEPMVPAGGGYDAMKLLISALSSSKTQDEYFDLKSIIKATVLNGAFGEVRFDENRCVIRQPVALKVEGGEIVPFTLRKAQ